MQFLIAGPTLEPPPLLDGDPSQEQQIQDGPVGATAGPLVIQGGDRSSKPGVVPMKTYLSKAKQQQACTKGKLKRNLKNLKQANFQTKRVLTRHPQAKPCPRTKEQVQCLKHQRNFFQTPLWLANFFPQEAQPRLRKPEFEDLGTGRKIPKLDSPTKSCPPFSVGMVYEHTTTRRCQNQTQEQMNSGKMTLMMALTVIRTFSVTRTQDLQDSQKRN